MRDISGEWQKNNFHMLVLTNSWRALAMMARNRLVTTDPEDLALVSGMIMVSLSNMPFMATPLQPNLC
ncbi:hypothetical protein C8R41DRAFT_964985 [Lentinula lateritia]|uniref:Uncharacterized protein n=1 Tax=Lentinula lateritia TaxID=40482 RepID=A0ABQ8VBB0_9AGAR|nr:hypothetical protein C8R41DRAFT_964985 [Lentinula lateritia]